MFLSPNFKGLITWRISARAEISVRYAGLKFPALLLKQILLKSNWRLQREGFSPNRSSAGAENPSPAQCTKTSNRNGVEKRAWTCAVILFSRKQDGCRGEGEAISVD